MFYQPIHLSTYLGIYLYTFPIAQQSTCLPIHMSHKQSGLQNGWLLRANIPSHGFSAWGGKSEDKEPAEPFCKDGRQSHSDHCHWLVEAKCRGSPGLYHENWINKSGSFPVPFATQPAFLMFQHVSTSTTPAGTLLTCPDRGPQLGRSIDWAQLHLSNGT